MLFRSGFEIMQAASGMPPMIPADDRRIAGWRVLREYISAAKSPSPDHPSIKISDVCHELIRCLPALMFDKDKPEDASSVPHSITHAPEALRYAVMSRIRSARPVSETPDFNFKFPRKNELSSYTLF